MRRQVARSLLIAGVVAGLASLPGCGLTTGVDSGGAAAQLTVPSGEQSAVPSGEDRAATSGGYRAASAPRARTVTVTRTVTFPKKTVRDPSSPKGTTVVRTKGRNGVERLTYRVTVVKGKTVRKLVKRVVVKAAVAQVTAVGTAAPAPSSTPACDPNYGGACVPIASDVDCEGGSGNGPAYVAGPVTVRGEDIYGLDGDGDGIGCE